jgi:hypothetical protein
MCYTALMRAAGLMPQTHMVAEKGSNAGAADLCIILAST